jgi:hypothetical protein
MRSKTLRPALLSTVLGLGLGLTVGACNPYDPDYGEIPFKCGPNDACPDGYTCNDSDLCALEGAEENCADDGPFEPNDSIDNATSTPVASERDTINYASLQYGVPVDQPRELSSRSRTRRWPRSSSWCRRPRRWRRSTPRSHPIKRNGSSLVVAMTDPSNIYAIDDIKFLTGYNIEVVVTSEAAIERARALLRGPRPRRDAGAGSTTARSTSSSTATTCDIDGTRGRGRRGAGRQAVQPDPGRRHQEAGLRHPRRAVREEFRVRYRIDGVLYEVMKPPLKLRNAHHLAA